MTEREIYDFKINRADADFSNGKLTVNLYYPNHPEPLHGRLKEQLDYGAEVYVNLIRNGSAQIADAEHPIKPTSGGLVLLMEGSAGKTMLVHRRGKTAPVHPLYHSLNAGYGNTKEHAYSSEGIMETGKREFAEEMLMITRDKEPWVVVPIGLEKYVDATLKRFGLDFGSKRRYIDLERIEEESDTLNVFDEKGKKIFTRRGFISPLWESATSLTIDSLYQAKGITADEVQLVCAEFRNTPAGPVHIPEEGYLLPLSQFETLKFGTPIENVEMFLATFNSGKIEVLKPEPLEYLGPERVAVNHPHLFAPDDQLVHVLGGMGIGEYAGKGRLQVELLKILARKEGKTLLPEDVVRG